MAEGKLIIELYEYVENEQEYPPFEYIPCKLSDCFKRNSKTTLKDIVTSGFDAYPKRAQNTEKRQEILRKLEDAGIGRIDVMYHPASNGQDSFIELTNLVQVTLTDADIRHTKKNKNSIILRDHYRLTEGNDKTQLRDAQRLTLIYSSHPEGDSGIAVSANVSADDDSAIEASDIVRNIYLNITYMQE